MPTFGNCRAKLYHRYSVEMTISVLAILKIVILFVIAYGIAWLIYRYTHPQYRWYQRGNVCYENAREFSFIVALASVLIFELIAHNIIKFVF